MTIKSSHGGSRAGAGRKTGSGPFGVPTRTVRVPESRIPDVVAYLHAFRPSAKVPDANEPGIAITISPRGFAANPPRRRTRWASSSVAAGFPSPADDYIESGLDFNEHLIVSGHKDASFVVRVEGWSMVGAGIFDGDEVIVDRAITPADGHVVVAIVNGELTIMRLRFKDGKPVLVAENPHFKERRLEEHDTLEIWGVATRVLHLFTFTSSPSTYWPEAATSQLRMLCTKLSGQRDGGRMGSLHSEYHRFLAHLEQREVHDDVRRLANLVLDHLDALAEVGAVRRGRSTRLAPLAIAHLAQMRVAYDRNAHGSEAGLALGRLHQLDVGPFRGFMRQETFDLSHDITLVYGANGTGKSSFCEALEVAMLGSISEAQAKRVDQRTYCNNARLRRHVAPVLSSKAADEAQAVQPDEAEYRFCFIEKNRLDDFARIAARTPGDQRQLIATLFGVDQFNEFVRGFNPALDQDLMLAGVQAARLAQRRLQLANSEQTITAHPQKIAAVEGQEQVLAQRMSPGATYNACVDWLLGTPEQQGRLPYVQAQLDANPPAIHEVTQARLQALLAEAGRVQGLWQASSVQLAARAGEVSYSNLYEAVLALADGATACPACGTGLAAVAQDPFARARTGLDQLAQLAALQQQEIELRTQLSEAVRALWDEMRRVLAAAAAACPAELQAVSLPLLPSTAAGNWLSAWVDGDQRAWQAVLRIADIIEGFDAQARDVHAQRRALVEERDRLQQHQLEIERLRTMRTTADQDLAAARQTVAQFDEANRDLIQTVAAEVPVVAHHLRIKAAYDGFLPEIQAYLTALPGVLLQGLGEQARQLYNAFNRADPPGDLLHALWLPLAENGKIEVEFAGEQGVRYDALVVFSEGHIKCLGLAILLAKNIAQGCPVVIFDDVVNAIDDDHRDGIWRTFFEDGLLDGKQVILTSHAEEFLHRIQQELGVRRASAIKRYKFLPHQGEHELRVDSDPPTKNYVLLAQEALAADEKREALRQARPALESLTDRLWTWLGRRADGRIDIKLSGPRSPWELNNKCSKLRSAVDRIATQHAGAPHAVAALAGLLNVSGTSIEWGYLNSGVHDAQRDHEFDRATVRTIVDSVTALDAALEVLQNR